MLTPPGSASAGMRYRSTVNIDSPLLTVQETAEYLKIPVTQVYRRVRHEVVPVKIGKHLRFEKRDRDVYIALHKKITR